MEHRTNKPPPTRTVQERLKGDATCPTTSQNSPHWNLSWLNNACSTKKDPESGWLTRDNQEANLIVLKPETANHLAEPFSWVSLPSCSPPRQLFLMKSLALSASLSTLLFRGETRAHFGALEDVPIPATFSGSFVFEQEASGCSSAYLIKSDFSIKGDFSSLNRNFICFGELGNEPRLLMLNKDHIIWRQACDYLTHVDTSNEMSNFIIKH